jgi:hypothetical protein
MDMTQFSYGLDGYIEVGDGCVFSNAIFMSELEIRVGARVIIGWNMFSPPDRRAWPTAS